MVLRYSLENGCHEGSNISKGIGLYISENKINENVFRRIVLGEVIVKIKRGRYVFLVILGYNHNLIVNDDLCPLACFEVVALN